MLVSEAVSRFLNELASAGQPDAVLVSRHSVAWLEAAEPQQIVQLLQALQYEMGQPSRAQDELLGAAFRSIIRSPTFQVHGGELIDHVASLIAAVYQGLGPASRARHHLLQMLALRACSRLDVLAELLVADPPAETAPALIVLSPLMQRHDYDPELLFPRLLDAMVHSEIAAAIVDLSNFVTRQGLVAEHPAGERRDRFIGLLGEIAQRLAQLEEQVGAAEGEAADLARTVEESVALAVALCDALGLIGDPAATGKLYQALELRHRRIRAEASAALARLGEEAGQEALVRLAEEPVARLRVLAYAEELDCLERVEPQYQTPAARAEAELAVWLAEPTQLGIPPTQMELIDERQLYWPGYEEPVDCFLLRFVYRLAEGEFSNIAIAGPCVHAFAADLADLPPDDIYAAFAGWQAEHEEIYETDVAQLSEASQGELARLERRLRDAGYLEIQPLKLGSFFGERALVARARRDAVSGVAVVDQDGTQWHGEVGQTRPIGADLAYSIYKGRKLLRSFNP